MHITGRDEMLRMERHVMEEIGISGAVLMEIAGGQVVDEIIHDHPERSLKITILVGGGNNGGDGFVISRRLFDLGYSPSVWLLVDAGKLSGDARLQYEIYTGRGLPIRGIDEGLTELDNDLASSEVVVDAMLGTGVKGKVREPFEQVIESVNALKGRADILSIDIPSGLECDNGRVESVAIEADRTLTFAMPKRGFFLQDGPAYVGEWKVKDISVPPSLGETLGFRLPVLITEELAADSLPERPPFGHKGTFGHALIIGGSKPYIGAPLYTADAAFMCGAGLATLAVPESIHPTIAVKNENGLLHTLPDEAGHFDPENEDFGFLDGATAVAVGPGMGRFDGGDVFIRKLIGNMEGQPIVIDADGLHHVKNQLDLLTEYDGPVILTPHPGEMGVLTGKSVADIEADRIGVAREFAEKHHVYLVLKGHRTIIATPRGMWINPNGNDGLSKGGSGDVLTGMIVSLLAQGAEPEDALVSAVYVHAISGEQAAKRHSHYGVVPQDIIHMNREIFRRMEEMK